MLNKDKTRECSDLAMFIITRNRPTVLCDTIESVFSQTFVPAHVLIVDNSNNSDTKKALAEIDDHRIAYHSVGYNAGPAGAAAIGMRILFERGFKWVLWGDDDDPPRFHNVIETLYHTGQSLESDALGVVGVVGGRFSVSKARMIRIPDNELAGILEADVIAGNMFPLIHRNVYDRNVLPDASLFFGFEELDFCLSVKRSGLKIFVSGEEMHRHRQKYNRLELKTAIYNKKSIDSLWREYYGVRNLLNLVLRKEKSVSGFLFILLRTLGKIGYGFRYGINYGNKNLLFLSKAFHHAFRGKMGLTIIPVSKRSSVS
jgi:GT2 family glycosyltransferase